MDSRRNKSDPQLRAARAGRAQEYPTLTVAVIAAVHQEGVSSQSARLWPVQAEGDDGARPGVTSEKAV